VRRWFAGSRDGREAGGLFGDGRVSDLPRHLWRSGARRWPRVVEVSLTAAARTKSMGKSRLEAFSDGVIAIIITIMVLELKVPRDSDLAALLPLIPVFLNYVLSFLYVGIYWNNHHHMFQLTTSVNGTMLWANLHLLFWLSTAAVHDGLDGGKPLGALAHHAVRSESVLVRGRTRALAVSARTG